MNTLNTIVWSGTTLVEPTQFVMHELQATQLRATLLGPYMLVPALIGDLAQSPLLDQSLIAIV